MQLVHLSNTLKPITLAVGLLSATSVMSYSDFDAYSGILTTITNNQTSNYIKSVDKNDNGYLMHKFRFQNHLINWQKKTLFLSSTKAIIENEDFQAIVAMGSSAVPYILESIQENPSTLVWALNLIFDRKITNNPDATISEACMLWVNSLKK